MKNNKYKILVLSDLKESTSHAIQNAVKLAKIINAEIEFFHVKKPTDIVNTDSQLSAMRVINKAYVNTERKITNMIDPIIENEGVAIQSSFVFGNIKNEIENQIDLVQPDVIVLGSRKRKVLSFMGDHIEDFIQKTYNKRMIIISKGESIDFEKEFSLDFLKQSKQLAEA